MIRCSPLLTAFFATVLQCYLAADSAAWSGQGHAAISLAVYQNLSPNAQQTFLNHATKVHAMSKESELRHYKYCKNLESVCHLAVWPDSLKEVPLRDVFERANLPVPESLRIFSAQDTAAWHYQNNFYSLATAAFETRCAHRDTGQLLRVIPLLTSALQRPLSEPQHAVVFAFWLHLVSDAHQPLHNITLLQQGCQHDLGGNKTCAATLRGRCELNLHQLWDSGAGVFEKPLNLTAFPNIDAIDIDGIQTDVIALAPLVYREGAYQDPAYLAFVRETSLAQANLAVQRIVATLEQLWSASDD